MASSVTRFAWTDDSGTPASPVGDGTKVNNAQLQLIFDAVDALFASGTFTLGGLLKVDGAGAHVISASTAGANTLGVRNTNTGTGAYADVRVGNSLSAASGTFGHLSSAFTTSGYYVADRTYLVGATSAGLVVSAEHASGVVYFGAGGNSVRGRVMANGRLAWDAGYATSGFTSTGLEIGGGGSSPNIAQMVFGDGSGYAFHIGTQVAGAFQPRLTVDDRGFVFAPNGDGTRGQPGFFAYNSSTDTGVTNGTTIDFDTEIFDEGGDFSGDTFTAPVTGRYLFSFSLRVVNASGGAGVAAFALHTTQLSSGIYLGTRDLANGATCDMGGTVIAAMTAGDTAVIKSISTVALTINGSNVAGGPRESWFCGRLLV